MLIQEPLRELLQLVRKGKCGPTKIIRQGKCGPAKIIRQGQSLRVAGETGAIPAGSPDFPCNVARSIRPQLKRRRRRRDSPGPSPILKVPIEPDAGRKCRN
jgi:hypothetical protein